MIQGAAAVWLVDVDGRPVIRRSVSPSPPTPPRHSDYGPELPLGDGVIPHYLPGTNPYLKEFSVWYGISYEATRGGAETMYPEYRSKLPQTWSTLDRCGRYCTCFNEGSGCPVKPGQP